MSIFERANVFFREVYVELKKTNWLTRNEVVRYTVIVLAVTIIVSVILGGLDYIFSETLKHFLLK